MAEELNIYQKLAKIGEMVEVIKKEKTGFNYNYVDIADILVRVRAGMRKYHLSLVPTIVPDTLKVDPITFVKTKISRDTKQPYDESKVEMVVSADTIMEWINNDDPSEKIVINWSITGCQEDPSQAFGSALTYCERQFLTAFFHIATVDTDVDTYRSKQREAEAAENQAIVAEIIKTIDEMSKDYVANAKDVEAAKEEILKLTSKYVKGGNYKKIDNPNLAAKLLQEFKDTFMKESD